LKRWGKNWVRFAKQGARGRTGVPRATMPVGDENVGGPGGSTSKAAKTNERALINTGLLTQLSAEQPAGIAARGTIFSSAENRDASALAPIRIRTSSVAVVS